jgi:hypothetical protein
MSTFNDTATRATDANRVLAQSGEDTSTTFAPSNSTSGGVNRVYASRGGNAAPTDVPAQGRGGVSISTGEVRRTVLTNGNSVETIEGNHSRSFTGSNDLGGVASIRSPLGSARSGSDVRPTDVIRVAGMETTVAAAMASGFITKDGQGNYHDVGAQQIEAEYKAEADRKAETSTKEPTVVPLDDASESLMQTFVQNVHPTDGALAVKNIIDGEKIGEETIARAASRLGTEPAIVRQQVAQLQEAFTNQARDYVGDKVLDHARQHDMAALREAAREQAMTGSMRGYQEIAQRHMAGLDRTDPQSILTSDDGKRLNARLNKSTGEVVLDIPGVGTTTWGAALKAGLIQPYFPAKRRY